MANVQICSVSECGKPVRCKALCANHYWAFMKYGDALGAKGTPPNAARSYLLEVVMPHDDDNCLFWPYAHDEHGYPRVYWDGRNQRAIRVVCGLHLGPPPSPEYEAAHSCGMGHKGCIAPRHLSWKTRTDNQFDRLRHGTHCRGSRHPKVVLTEDDVRAIRRARGLETLHQLASKYGVGQTTIHNIHSGKTWSWLP